MCDKTAADSDGAKLSATADRFRVFSHHLPSSFARSFCTMATACLKNGEMQGFKSSIFGMKTSILNPASKIQVTCISARF
ncbi:hypothetical protein K239x_32940 [Planctomycetes bacterium K23_9]|uniref:Uncharacterized protein n=1 Tax=Stieleria marina TaxID=1930275 RepID=A0A517NW00_9BACT|nr:hypothetical protein K239x_32940 [Planctomycetes bacterium K23_9]